MSIKNHERFRFCMNRLKIRETYIILSTSETPNGAEKKKNIQKTVQKEKPMMLQTNKN